jgi:hypothetical protein|tara:strand:+ start:3194 stop:3388 length:195 start_codon:yes stop_codon:yes gene_type:complete
MDPIAAPFKIAKQGDFVKDLSKQKRSLGLVMQINKETKMMRVRFPKINKDTWVMWTNYGQYKVV